MTILEELKQTAVNGDAPYERKLAAKAAAEIERLNAELEQAHLDIATLRVLVQEDSERAASEAREDLRREIHDADR